jgi:hypothetical protein
MVAEENNKFAAFSWIESGIPHSKWEVTNADEIEAYTGALIYMGIMDIPTLEYYFYGHILYASL